MSRSPLAYPLTRGVDGDAGGAADLQTDIMRFMAILSLCLVAIFALVQSLPMAPENPTQHTVETPPSAVLETPETTVFEDTPPVAPAVPSPPVAAAAPAPSRTAAKPATPLRPVSPIAPAPPKAVSAPPPAPAAQDGFTLRFASDIALTRLVARGDIGFYAIRPDGAARLSVRESRLNFWEAPLPAAFHEMERPTVPQPVVEALEGSGGQAGSVRWGVTLPSNLKQDLDRLMREYSGGALVIGDDGTLRREAS